MNSKVWTTALLLATLPALPVCAGVFYSPVFNMPLQPAPSTFDGGFYWVAPNGVVYGPNYYLVPPFNPTSGFDNVFVGQRFFGKMYTEAVTGVKCKDGSGGMPPAKQIGVGGYKLDYSDPDTVKNFDATAPMPNGYVPFGAVQPPPQTYGNGPLPMPRYANYPHFGAAAPMGYGFRPCGMVSQGPAAGVYQAGYCLPGYYGQGYYGQGYYGRGYYGQASYGPAYYGQSYYGPGYCGAYGQEPIRQVQAAEPCGPPPMPFPQGQALAAMYPNLYNQGCPNPARVCVPMPATPNYSMPYCPLPMTPNCSMAQTCFPPLPNPCYEPPCCEENPNLPKYFTSSAARSPRDFFMWKEVQEDKLLRARLPLTVPQ